MDIAKRTLTSIEETVLKHDLLDIQDWVKRAIDGKVNNCKKRMITEWTPILMDDDSVDSIPADEDKLIELIVARSDYKSRADRDSE